MIHTRALIESMLEIVVWFGILMSSTRKEHGFAYRTPILRNWAEDIAKSCFSIAGHTRKERPSSMSLCSFYKISIQIMKKNYTYGEWEVEHSIIFPNFIIWIILLLTNKIGKQFRPSGLTGLTKRSDRSRCCSWSGTTDRSDRWVWPVQVESKYN